MKTLDWADLNVLLQPKAEGPTLRCLRLSNCGSAEALAELPHLPPQLHVSSCGALGEINLSSLSLHQLTLHSLPSLTRLALRECHALRSVAFSSSLVAFQHLHN